MRVSSTLPPGSLLDTVQQKIDSGDKTGAGQIFEEHVQHVDCSHANADHFAQLVCCSCRRNDSRTHAPSWSGGRGYMLIPAHMLRPGVGDGGIC